MSAMVVSVPFPTSELAEIARQSLEPDSEVKPAEVQKAFEVVHDELHVTFNCASTRMARVSLQAFFDNLEVVVRTMHELQHI